jgi:peptidoglycan hydrolase-like protein with peptidoglycan-binding domain
MTVKESQAWLNGRGFTDKDGHKLVEDNKLGLLTESAVSKFQTKAKSMGLYPYKVDGNPLKYTQLAMVEYDKKIAAQTSKPVPLATTIKTTDSCKYSPRYLKDHNIKQDTSTWCALNAVQQVFYELFGVLVEEKTLFNYGYTTSSGTGPNEIKAIIMRLAKQLNVKVKITTYDKSDISWDGIGKLVESATDAVFFHELYKAHSGWGHWDYCVGVCPINVYMANSLQGAVVGYSKPTMESWFKGITSDNSVYVVTKL